MLSGEDGIVLTFDLRVFDKGSVLLTTPGPTSIKGMALNPLDPNYFFICGDSPNLHLYDARKVEIPAARWGGIVACLGTYPVRAHYASHPAVAVFDARTLVRPECHHLVHVHPATARTVCDPLERPSLDVP